MSKIYRWGALIALAALMVVPVQAQTETPADEQPDAVVVVTAERTSQPASESIASATVVTAKQIKEQGAQTVADVLRMVPGVTLRQSGQTGSAATAFVRGAKANQVLVLVDGQRISSPSFIITDLSKFPITDVSRVEVIRGPVSSLYGSDAIGGVVNIITKRPTGNAGDLALGFGTHSRQERSLSLRSASDKMSWQLFTSMPTYEGSQENSDYSATNMSARVTLPSVKGWELSLSAQDYHDALGLPGPTASPSPNDNQWWKRSSIGLSGVREMLGGQVQWNVYRSRQHLEEINPDWMVDSKVTGVTDAGEITFRRESGKNSWVTGIELRNENYRDIESSTQISDKSISNQGLFVQDRISLTEKADAVLGLRYDDHSTAGSRMTPRAGITYALRPGMNLRASYSSGFRAPSLLELYYNGSWGTGNPNLVPERSKQYEIGLGIQRENESFDVALFLNNVRDQITWISDPITWLGTYENTDRTRHKGIELTYQRRLRNSVTLAASYTYLDVTNLTTGQRLLGVPHNHLTLTASGMVKSWQVALSGRYTDNTPDFGNAVVQNHTVFDLMLQQKSDKPTNPYVTVRNLFDASYEEVGGYPTEGFSIEAGMRTAW